MEETRDLLLGEPTQSSLAALSENDIPQPASPLPLPSSEITYSEPALTDSGDSDGARSGESSRNPSGSESAPVSPTSPVGPVMVGIIRKKLLGEDPKPKGSGCDVRFAPSPISSSNCLKNGHTTAEQSPLMSDLTVPENEMDKMSTSLETAPIGTGQKMNPPENGHVNHALRPPLPATVTRSGEHTESFTAREHHTTVQNNYRKNRRRHFTDPVDFEGILNIIGGCGWWQIWVYLLISLQQIPHAMFNLSVVYMMFQPDHWCKVPGLDLNHQRQIPGTPDHHHPVWNVTAMLRTGIALPQVYNKQREKQFHSQCEYYVRGVDLYSRLIHMPLDNATAYLEEHNETIAPQAHCSEWEFDESVMTETIVTQWQLVCEDNIHRADAQLAYSLGFLVGCLISGLSSDRFGRKPTIIGFGVLASMFGIILPYSNYFYMFLLIRFLSAVCNEAADLAAYVLCMEITGTKYRAMVGSFLQAPWAIGYALLAVVAYLTKSWKSMQIVTAALHTVTILLICVLPESPRWLIVNNRVREAERIIRKACRMNKSNLPADLELVKHAEQRRWVKRNQRAHLGHLLKSRELLFRTGIIYVIWAATALVYYGLVIALSDQSGPGRALFSGNFFVNNAVAGAIELPTLVGCVFLLRFGRKKSQMGTLIMAGVMIIAAMICYNHTPSGFVLVFMMLGKVCIQAAFNILYIFTSELYPTVIRNSAVGTSSMVARLGAGVSSYVAILSDLTVPIVPLVIFGVFSLVAGVMVVFLPETRDQPLPDTLQDAVTFLKPESHYACMLGGGWTGTTSISEEASPRGGNKSAQRRQGAGKLPQKSHPPIKISMCDEDGIMRDMAELDIPSHPDNLPEID